MRNVSLKCFRNFESLNIELESGVNVFYGNNAQGKTNFLEAIYMCSTGRSWRTHFDRELIFFKENEAHIKLIVNQELGSFDKIDVHLRKDGKKGIAINSLPIKRLGQLFGHLLTVVFSPEDLQLIKSGPAERRRFMDIELCQLSNIYYYELQQYHHILKQRNNLLKTIRTDKKLKETVFIWDEQLVSHGAKIINFRYDFINRINEIARNVHLSLTNDKERLGVVYRQNVRVDDFLEKLAKNFERDVQYGKRLIKIL